MAIQKNAYVLTDETGRICSITGSDNYIQGASKLELPDDFDFSIKSEYRIVDGRFIHDPILPPQPDVNELKKEKRLAQMEDAIMLFVATSTLTDEQALKVSSFYEEWDSSDKYEKDDICVYGFKLYRCRSAHSAQESWNPADAHSLWAEIVPPGKVLEWRPSQPGIFDGYQKGQKVIHKGGIWVSTFDGLNVWEPGVYGWVKEADENA